LNEREIAALQAVAYNTGGALFGSADGLSNTISNHRQCRAIEELSQEEIDGLLDKLMKEGLINNKLIKGKLHFGLTEDGQRCNLIDV
jgi:hypothetical protein